MVDKVTWFFLTIIFQNRTSAFDFRFWFLWLREYSGEEGVRPSSPCRTTPDCWNRENKILRPCLFFPSAQRLEGRSVTHVRVWRVQCSAAARASWCVIMNARASLVCACVCVLRAFCVWRAAWGKVTCPWSRDSTGRITHLSPPSSHHQR